MQQQGNCRCKMARTGIHSFAELNAQILRFATTLATRSQVHCGWSGSKQYKRPVQACGNPLSNLDYCLWQSVVW
jgi:hypothetical protein